jgi:hypothetical protein
MTQANRQLVTTGADATDLRSTMLRIIEGHALTAAQQVRWRMSHLNLSSSNMKMDGGMLDLTTQRAHPRLPPIHPDHSLLDSETATYPDYADRTGRIITIYQALRRSMLGSRATVVNAEPISIRKEMDQCYRRHLQHQLLCAAGLRTKIAESLLQSHAAIAERFTSVLIEMARLKNPSRRLESRGKISSVAVLDIFHLLATYPGRYFAKPEADNAGFVRKALRPIYKGSPARAARKRAAVGRLIPQFCSAYHDVMQAVQSRAGEHYGSVAGMQRSIQSRATFENRPIPLMFRKKYCDDFDDAIAAYRSSGSLEFVRQAIDDRISASSRNIDQLLRQGQSLLLEDGALELQIRVIDGVRYSVQAWNHAEQRRSLHIEAPMELVGTRRSPVEAAGAAQGCACGLRYRFTTDDWMTSSEVPVHVDHDPQRQTLVARSTIVAPCAYGELQGYFHDTEGEGKGEVAHPPARRYVFAIPDPIELSEMLEEAAAKAGRLTLSAGTS